MAEADIDEALIAAAKAVVVTGTHFSTATLDAASRKAMRLAREHGGKVVLDIDYRPVLWGLTGHGLGEERFVADDAGLGPPADHPARMRPDRRHRGGDPHRRRQHRHDGGAPGGAGGGAGGADRGQARADGLHRLPRRDPGDIEEGVSGPGFPVEVFNVLGAGDAFMSGFLRGWLRDLPLEECCRLANACGAFAVSRHGCAPAIPSWTELEGFLRTGSDYRRLREDAKLEQVHWATNRGRALAAGAGLRLRPPLAVRGDVRPCRHQRRAHPATSSGWRSAPR